MPCVRDCPPLHDWRTHCVLSISARTRLAGSSLPVFVVCLCLASTAVVGSLLSDPVTPVCATVSSLPFCDVVNYTAVVDASDASGSDADAAAVVLYGRFVKVLGRFDCSLRYSLHTCEDCKGAYKRWLCATKLPQCGPSGGTGRCPVRDLECSGGLRRMCLSLCEDVVRKCPYSLSFKCPTGPSPDYSSNLSTCNKLDRAANIDGRPWPATFAG